VKPCNPILVSRPPTAAAAAAAAAPAAAQPSPLQPVSAGVPGGQEVEAEVNSCSFGVADDM
jgi:hypothetical protein